MVSRSSSSSKTTKVNNVVESSKPRLKTAASMAVSTTGGHRARITDSHGSEDDFTDTDEDEELHSTHTELTNSTDMPAARTTRSGRVIKSRVEREQLRSTKVGLVPSSCTCTWRYLGSVKCDSCVHLLTYFSPRCFLFPRSLALPPHSASTAARCWCRNTWLLRSRSVACGEMLLI